MTIANNVASKLFVAFVAAAMLFTLATPAKAATTDELQAQIAALMAQIAALQGGSSDSMSHSGCTFTRALTLGSQGADVKCLQDAMTPTYFNNPGGSTGYFGPMTQAAVAKWQTANGVSPASGYFGPVSQAKYNAMMAMDDDHDGGDTDGGDTDGGDTDSEPSDSDLSGEASLDTFEVSDGEDADDVEEESEDVQVAEFAVEFSDGDAMITRLDIALQGGGDETDPWDTFSDVSLWVDGDEVARMDASDEDEYLDEDDGSLRFAGLDIVAKEDEEVTIVVAVSVVSGVDSGEDGEDWDVFAGSMRYVDGDDVTSTDNSTGDLESDYTDPSAAFTIEVEGAGDDLDLEGSDEDPESTTLALDEDDNKEYAIFAFDLSAEDSDRDVDLNEIVIDVNVTGATNVDDLVNDFRIEVDGESYDADSYTGTALHAELTFDINGESSVAKDEVATVVLFADFEDMESADEGSTIFASTSPTDIDAESADDIVVDGSAKVGNTHTLRTQGLTLADEPADGKDGSDSVLVTPTDTIDDQYGTMFLEFEITAFGDDLWVKTDDAFRGAASSTKALSYQILAAGTATTAGAVSIDYDIEGADEDNGYFELEDGETYTMVVTIESYNPTAADATLYSFRLNGLGFNDTEDTVADTGATPDDTTEYVSDGVSIDS